MKKIFGKGLNLGELQPIKGRANCGFLQVKDDFAALSFHTSRQGGPIP